MPIKTKPTKPAKAPTIKWSGLVSVEDITLKRSRYGTVYAVLHTSAGLGICASEQQAQTLCLFEPYEFSGEIKVFLGGLYLKLGKAELFQANKYRQVIG